MEETQETQDWRNEISEPKDTLKVKPDSSVVFNFQDEGLKKESIDYGSSIVFGVKVSGETETKLWYVSSKNYDLLGQIKALGNLIDLKVKVTRKGSKRSDTRYTIEKA